MAHYFESGAFSNGKPAWHGLGKVLPADIYLQPADLLQHAGLNWTVEKRPMYLEDGSLVPRASALVRSTDGQVLNVVGNEYHVFQNSELLGLAEALVGLGAKFETAMSLKGGQVVTMLARLEPYNVLGDKFIPYLSAMNYHGSGARKVYLTDIREVCWNTHSWSIGKAERDKRVWSKPHYEKSLELSERNLKEARQLLGMAEARSHRMVELANELVRIHFNKAKQEEIVNNLLFPVIEGMTKKQLDNIENQRWVFNTAIDAPDLADYKGTGWGLLGAATAYQTHVTTGSLTTKSDVRMKRQENRVLEVIEHASLEKKVMDILFSLN